MISSVHIDISQLVASSHNPDEKNDLSTASHETGCLFPTDEDSMLNLPDPLNRKNIGFVLAEGEDCNMSQTV